MSWKFRTSAVPAPSAERNALLPGQEIAQVHELAMFLILNIDDPPSVLSAADALTINRDSAL